ncbi:MAG: hypothetical protein DSZ29_08010 [Aquificaceae bacterium]|nr:MAG: hypothetical protein DSZ29_08010 [Aquificaceae bacterium]
MKNTTITSISQFLSTSDFQYRVYDLGRKLTLLPNQQFQSIEDQEIRYPYPFQQKAWLAILFWTQNKEIEPVIWFLQFPIDEMGYLKLSARDAFLQELLIHVGNNLYAQDSGKEMQDSLKESAFAFKPRQDRLAIFHAFATVQLKQAPSHYYAHTRDYLQGKIGYEQWEFLGLQGIADVIARLHLDNNEHLLSKAIPKLPAMPLVSFAENLEHNQIGGELSLALNARLQEALNADKPDSQVIAALVRAISSSKGEQARKKIIFDLLQTDIAKEIEVIAAIAGRAWQDITQEDLILPFMEALAHQEQDAFTVILVDIMGIPNMREPILKALRNPERSNLLSKRIGGFLGGFAQTH